MNIKSRLQRLEVAIPLKEVPTVHYVWSALSIEGNWETLYEDIPLEDWEAGQATGKYPQDDNLEIVNCFPANGSPVHRIRLNPNLFG